jgi:hypothetical protein
VHKKKEGVIVRILAQEAQCHGWETAREQTEWCFGLLVLTSGGPEGEGRCEGLAMELTGARERRSGWAIRVKWW